MRKLVTNGAISCYLGVQAHIDEHQHNHDHNHDHHHDHEHNHEHSHEHTHDIDTDHIVRVAQPPDYELSYNENNLHHKYIDIEEFEEQE